MITYHEYEFYRFTDMEVVGNELYVAEAFAPRLYKVDPLTGDLDVIIDDWSLYYFYDVAFDGTHFYVTEWNLNKYDIDGNKIGTASFDEDVMGSAYDGTYYWTLNDAGEMKCWDLATWPDLTEITGNAFSAPSANCRGLWFDGSFFWTAESLDSSLGQIYQFNYDGEVLQQLLEPAFSGWGVCKMDVTLPTATPTPPPTVTFTPTTSPTHSPTSTPTPVTSPGTPTPPTATPDTVTPSSTPTAPDETPTFVPTGTAAPPTATPLCEYLGARLWMPAKYFSAGDSCACRVELCNPGPGVYPDIRLFVILDVYGDYFFAPTFTEFNYYEVEELTTGPHEIEVLSPFSWPEGAGSAGNIVWYAGMSDSTMNHLLGQMDMWIFGWGD